MTPKPLKVTDLLKRFEFKESTPAFDELRRDSVATLEQGRLLEAARQARDTLREGSARHDRHRQAYVFAYLAAVHTEQKDFGEAVQRAEDCHSLFEKLGDKHNASVAKALLAAVYQAHLDSLSDELAELLQDGQTESKALEGRAVEKGGLETKSATTYHQHFVELGEQARRARWMRALPHSLPLIWVPVVESIPPDADTRGIEPVAFMEPILFTLRSRAEAEQEQSGDLDPGQIVDQLYSARPLPSPDSSPLDPVRPPRLRPNALYAAVKIDPDSAGVARLNPEDYLLVRMLSLAERAELLEQAEDGIRGIYFQLNAQGEVEVVKAIPPKFVGEDEVRMFVAQVDAVLRRVP